MKEDAAVMALAAAYADDPLGTPAGNAGLTQEQLAVMRERGLRLQDVELLPVLIPIRPACPGAIPTEHRAQAEMVQMPCPVMGWQLIAPGIERPTMLLPNGQFAVPRE